MPFTSEEVSDCTSKRVLAAGRYDFQKNFSLLLRIWSQIAPSYPDWKLEIIGDGALRPALEKEVVQLGLSSSVELSRPTQEMQAVYLHSSVYAMTSRYEGLPMVLIEAQQMGLPIVSFACPCGPRDVIHEGEDGFLIPLGEEDAFIRALRQLLDSEAERQRMGQAACLSSARYDVDTIMAHWIQLFDTLSVTPSSTPVS